MTVVRKAFGVLLAGSVCAALVGCAPLRLDDTPRIRGTLVAVEPGAVDVKHKTGRTYHVEVTPDTRIVNSSPTGDATLCAGRRATVSLVAPRRFTESSITLWSGRCR
jgi:hypothetical protein